MSVILASLSAIFYGTADFAGGYAVRKNSMFPVLLVSQSAGLLLAALAIPLLGGGKISVAAFVYGGLGGAIGAFGLFMLYRGIARTVVAVVSPASALVGALVPMLFGIAIGERPSLLAIAGAAICLPAILLLVYEKSDARLSRSIRSALIHGVLAGIGFGGFFIAVSRTPPDSGLWPLAASRTVSILSFAAFALGRRERIRIERGSRALVLAAGLFDMGANVLFLLAARSGLLFLAASISSLFPGPTVLLARVFMGQKLGPVRLIGLALALAGVALISAG
jgi:drug/metabolite transporter (DMT)-like permease